VRGRRSPTHPVDSDLIATIEGTIGISQGTSYYLLRGADDRLGRRAGRGISAQVILGIPGEHILLRVIHRWRFGHTLPLPLAACQRTLVLLARHRRRRPCLRGVGSALEQGAHPKAAEHSEVPQHSRWTPGVLVQGKPSRMQHTVMLSMLARPTDASLALPVCGATGPHRQATLLIFLRRRALDW
jgi:hypothetical protein